MNSWKNPEPEDCDLGDAPHLNPETWLEPAETLEGSWWPAWTSWLATHSGERIKVPDLKRSSDMNSVLAPAPGRYVRDR